MKFKSACCLILTLVFLFSNQYNYSVPIDFCEARVAEIESPILSWNNTYDVLKYDFVTELFQTRTSRILCGGKTTDDSAETDYLNHGYLMEIDDDGTHLWTRIYHDARVISAIECISGGYAFTSSRTYTHGAYLFRVDSNGYEIWNRTLNVHSVGPLIEVPSGGFFLLGYDNASKVVLVKTDQSGYQEWVKEYDDYTDDFQTLIPCNDGGYLLVGSGYNLTSGLVLIKLDADGNRQWDNMDYDWIVYSDGQTSVIQDTDDNYVIAYTGNHSGSSSSSINLLKIDSLGNEIWNQTDIQSGTYSWPHTGTSVGSSIGGYAISAWTQVWYPSTHEDYVLVRTNSEGELLWNFEFEVPIYSGYRLVPELSNFGNDSFVIAGFTPVSDGFDIWIGFLDDYYNELPPQTTSSITTTSTPSTSSLTTGSTLSNTTTSFDPDITLMLVGVIGIGCLIVVIVLINKKRN